MIVAALFQLIRLLLVGPADGSPWTTMMFRFRISAILLSLYWVCLFVLTHIPGRKLDGLPLPGDKLLHFAAFLGLGLLLAWTVSAHRRLRPVTLLLLWLVVVIYAIADEWLQNFVPNRYADWQDGVADSLGGAAGLMLFVAVATLAKRYRQEP